MKTSHQCPKCGGRKLWVIEKVREVEVFGKYGGRKAAVTASVTAVDVLETGVLYDSPGVAAVGTVECWACAACGYVEYYAHQLEQLEAAAKNPSSGVRLVDAGAPAPLGPHR